MTSTTNTTAKNETKQTAKQTARQMADGRALFNYKKTLLAKYNVKSQSKLTAEQKAEFDQAVKTFTANLTKTADSKTDKKQKQTDSKTKQSKDKKQKQNKAEQKQTDKKQDREAKQKQTAEQKQKQIDSITNNIDVTINADKHYIAKANKYLVKFQVSAKEVKIRCNKAYAEATAYTTELHDNWNVKYAITDATVEQIIAEFKKLTAEADKKQKEEAKNEK